MRDNTFSKKVFIKTVSDNLKNKYRKTIDDATQQELYQAVSEAVKDVIMDEWIATQRVMDKDDPKVVYYMSMEFLMGRALGNNLINLSAYKEVKEALDEIGVDINAIEDQEPDPALGNGGLGRLAACFMDSLATLGYPAYGCGIRYRYGMFKQQISDGFQIEVPDNWLKDGYPFELRRPEYCYEVKFGGYVQESTDENGELHFEQKDYQSVLAVPYDMPIVGYDNNVVNSLMIWDAEPKNGFSLESFDQGDYDKAVEQENLARNLVEVLYPNDNHVKGKELRLKQQYFFVSASIQRALARFKKHHSDLKDLPNKVVFQMNDTHPTVAVAELMRILVDEEHLPWDDAWDITTRCVAYTNHTIMAEALEKWPIEIFQRLLPRVYQIVDEINRRFVIQINEKYPSNEDKVRKMAILYDGQVKMANMAIVAGYSVNGVAKLHTEILKNQELHDFYEMFPEKFNNKTNGITQRRFLAHANPLLADWATKKVGAGWITDLSLLSKLKAYADSPVAQQEFAEIKRANKVRLAKYIKEHNGIDVNPDSIFDVQVKRLHEYKRQLLNAFSIMTIYFRLKDKKLKNWTPTTYIFGAKAAPGYARAKAIIKYINEIAKLVNNDPETKDLLQVYFISNYNVSYAEKIVVAADLSEQTSTAGLEASGTGNMKFMLNGAPTLGTLDGANVEIAECAGIENEYIFGAKVEDIERMKKEGYHPKALYDANPEIKRVVDTLIDGTFDDGGAQGEGSFKELHDSLLKDSSWQKADNYFLIYDLPDYVDTKIRANTEYANRKEFGKKCLINIANAGKFSSDRTILQYAKEIWHTSYKK